MTRPERESAIRWAAVGTLLVLQLLRVERIAPVALVAPETILTNTRPDAEPLIRFLRRIDAVLPPGAEATVISTDPTPPVPPDLLHSWALGQLPGRRLLHGARRAWGDTPEWIAVFGGEIDDPRYDTVASFAEGTLARRRS